MNKVLQRSKQELEVANAELLQKNESLLKANKEVSQLSGLLPICARCKNIRDDKGYWKSIESYISAHSQATFSHGLCENCSEELYGEQEFFKQGQKKDNAS